MYDLSTIKKEISARNYSPIYLLMGEEPFYIDEITKLFEADQSFERTVFYGKDVTSADIILEAGQTSMFADKRMLIVKEAQDIGKNKNLKGDINNISPYTEHINDKMVLVICYKYSSLPKTSKLFKAIEKVGAVFESSKMYEDKIPSWIKSYVTGLGLKIDDRATALLAESIGTNLSAIAAAIEKLKAVAKGGTLTEITSQLVSDNIGINNEYNIFEFQSALLAHNVTKVNKIVKVFCNNPKEYPMPKITASLFSEFQKLFTYHYLPEKSEAALAKATGVNPYVAKIKYIPASKIYNARKCMQNIEIIRNFDMKSKGYGSAETSTAELLPLMVYKLLN